MRDCRAQSGGAQLSSLSILILRLTHYLIFQFNIYLWFFSDSESESDSDDSDDSVDSDYDSNSPGPSGSSKKPVDEKIKIEDVPENIKKRLAPAPKKGMVLVKKKKVEAKPVDDELEKKKKMLAYTQGNH